MKLIYHNLYVVAFAIINTLMNCTPKEGEGSDLPESSIKNNTENGVVKSPVERLLELVGSWKAIENTFIGKEEKNKGTMICIPAASGHALSSSYNQGSGDSYYEANALWGYSDTTKEVKVFEVNSLGFIDTHIGHFDSSGSLIIVVHDQKTNALLQHRVMSWNDDTLKMEASFSSDQDTIKHKLTMTRQRN